jgi:hypothetical protein
MRATIARWLVKAALWIGGSEYVRVSDMDSIVLEARLLRMEQAAKRWRWRYQALRRGMIEPQRRYQL